MAKILIKTEKVTPFGGIFPIMGAFDRFWGKIVYCVTVFFMSKNKKQMKLFGGVKKNLYLCSKHYNQSKTDTNNNKSGRIAQNYRKIK